MNNKRSHLHINTLNELKCNMRVKFRTKFRFNFLGLKYSNLEKKL
jgi:hypothetical protein